MQDELAVSRRFALKGLGLLGATAALGRGPESIGAAEPPPTDTGIRKEIYAKVWKTPLIDTHEHLIDEHDRLTGHAIDDWSLVLDGYLGSDLMVAGLSREARSRFYSKGPSPREKWKLIEPYWPAVKNTGYGQAARISIRALYGVDELSAATVDKVQEGYDKLRRPGFYRQVLCELAKIDSCQVNCLHRAFLETRMPLLLMQDIAIHGMFGAPGMPVYSKPAGIQAKTLDDWHRVMDWWFDRYGRYAVAVKTADAYRRDIDYRQVPSQEVAEVYKRTVEGRPVDPESKKALEDHLFWYAVKKANEHRLPVKVHTGYYSDQNNMPLSRLRNNPSSACELCKSALDTPFVFMHLAYPYYEELIAVAKQYSNAHVDMCWGWIINPIAAKDFLKKFLVTAPANKILTFGGDYVYVEQVLGHALIARHGIALALSELVEEGWLRLGDALELIDPITHGNARRIFHLDEKKKLLSAVPWPTE